MPEALARADYDYTVSEEAPPRRRARPRAADRIEPMVSRAPQMIETSRGAGSSRARRIAVTLLRHPLRTLVSLASGVIAFSFIVNILFMQSGPHPAPLFAGSDTKREPVQEARLQEPRATAAQHQSASVETTGGESAPIARAASKAAQPAATHAPRSAPPSIVAPPPARPVEAQKPAAKQPEFDPIAQFLRGVSPPAPATTGSTDVAAETRRVGAAQRALARLGHKIDIDGIYGPGTRAAIQKFERDNKLPVTGELNPRTLKALSTRASIPIP